MLMCVFRCKIELLLSWVSEAVFESDLHAHFVCRQPCHVVYTDYRPIPLQHYIYPAGGDGLHLVVDENVSPLLSLPLESLFHPHRFWLLLLRASSYHNLCTVVSGFSVFVTVTLQSAVVLEY